MNESMRNFDFMKRSLGLVALFLMISVQGAWAQWTVKGTVNDEAGEPVIGASVKVVGSNTGGLTDINGKFSVNASQNGQLEISFVGYTTQKVKINGQSNLNITLREDAQMLNDVVVVGYGTMKKSDISGSVATVDQEAVMKRMPQNVGQALQGAAAGVMVNQQDGSPDGRAAIRIRGISTINGTADPLYVVDGVQVGTNADFVNPSDIERIEILKDASATAIYGSAGANGVVMITTKHGVKGKTNINVTADFGLQTLPYKLDVLDINTFASALREAKVTNQKDMLINQVWDAKYDGRRNEIDWQDVMTRTALRQQYGVSVNGGSDKTQYNLSFGWLNVDGIVINTNYKRFTSRANLSTKVNKYLEVGGDINYTHSESDGSNASLGNNQNLSSMRDFASLTPTLDYLYNNDAAAGNLINVNLENVDGSYGTGYQASVNGWEGNTAIGGNPYASQMENANRARNGYDRIQTTAFIDLTLLDIDHHKVDIRSQGTYTYWASNNSDYTGGRRRFNMINGALTEVAMQQDQSYAFSLYNDNNYSLGLQTYLTYNLDWNIHNLTLMVGNEISKNWGQNNSSSARYFPSVLNRNISLTEKPDDIQGGGGYNLETRTISYFARASYNLMDRYILTATVRRDGSSNFGSGNRWGTFPSVAGAWRISEEPFMKDVKFVNNLKLRIGWGQTGNAGNMGGKAVYALSADAAYNFYGEDGISGAFGGNRNRETGWFTPLIDENLKWETNEMANIGIDFAFLNDWDVSLDYFIKTTKDLLLYQQFRPSAGNTQVYTNYGKIENKGFEIALGYHKQLNKDLGINVRLTGSTISNKVKKMGDPLYNTASGNNGASAYDNSQVGAIDGSGYWNNHSICMEGEAVGSYYGYLTDGIIRDEADLADYKARIKSDSESKCDGNHPLSVGDMKFKDINGDGTIDQNDRVILGNGFPSLNFGITVGANYKDFDFNLYMYGVLGQDILSYSAMKMSNMGQLDDQTVPNILPEAYDQAFRNGSGSLPRLTILDPNRNYRVSDMWVKNGNFLRVGNLQVGYTLPRAISQKLSIQKARVYIGVNNLLTISPYTKYGDPECGSGSVLYSGLDTGRYPQPRTFMGGVNVTF